MLPKAREDGLVVRQLAADTMIVDERTNNVHCLNELAGLVYAHANGQRNVAAIADAICEIEGKTATVESVELALEQLSERDLLMEPMPATSDEQRMKRRGAIKQLAKLMAVPVVLSLAARRASADHICFTTFESRSTDLTPMGTMTTVTFFNQRETCLPDPPPPDDPPPEE